MGLSRKNAERCVVAIRRNRYIGNGTCSTIDECYSDEELMTELMQICPQNSVHGGLTWMIEIEAIMREREEAVRNEIF